uniref:Tudor domain-containing protein n=1 Tax=Mucochytrium quahogii TaxID=96639 RepID=A0A7S2WJ14_9STRA|mmetsp:Transcript_25661/g.41338  ORF Transcript_25661/g.41338 Transcript_25661/m.41338 type:complete len:314 (-) Transcript_25661:971-1912(-)|eukprot:CAMPEP_0203762842 /NCGR_PEP_ID=MMETSP0098-20131031/15633_1 /ASSEMBLY_ACC=CAM_ASM_000208 /TAXON_ID=96639 /ORGANISM=" , Strain NY0313808BC1" /LENGTH=313 /DNA_ID=CAMNT_0050657405 /DNA_START=146 /DNA_END=1087 /DNA_ORIENTATION=-
MDTSEIEKQLADVRNLLASDPENSAFKELEKSLQDALSVMQDDSDEEESSEEEEEDVPQDKKNETEPRVTDEVSKDTTVKAVEKQPLQEPVKPVQEPVQPAENAGSKKRKRYDIREIRLGSHCEYFNSDNGVWQAASLESYGDGENNVDIRVFHDGTEQKVKAIDIRPIKKGESFDRTKLQIGLKCKAKYSGDGVWYQGTILSVTTNGCFVRFKKYNNQEEVVFEHIKLLKPDEAAQPNETSEVKPELSAQIASIPKHLQIQAGDSEKIKERKRRKLRNFKKETNRAKKELIQDQKKQGWQAFQAKKKKKKLK